MRRVDTFFYGLFMDEDLLRAKGLAPANRALGVVDDYALRIGQRATMVRTPGARVHGVLFSLTQSEVSRLYDEPSVQAYRPEAVLARLDDGALIPALCYTLPLAPAADERNPEYASKLRALAERIGLAAEYVHSID